MEQRTIKFRAWDKILKYMLLPDDGDNWLSFEGQYFTTPDRTYDTPNTEIKKRTDVILMQFTGLIDKNGKEVYEGDILNVAYAHRDDDGYVVSDPPARGFVSWDNHSTGWVVRTQSKMSVTPDGTVMTSIISKEPGYIEVVGNKYANYELLTRAVGV